MPAEDRDQRTCAYTQGFLDMMRAAPPKRDWLRKTSCLVCEKVFWANRDTDYCFDCESKASK